MKAFSIRFSWGGFLIAAAIDFIPTLLLGLAATLLLPPMTHAPAVLLPAGILASIVDTVLLPPTWETLVLVYPCSLAIQAVPSQVKAALIGSAPIVLLHLTAGWQKPLVIAWPFFWSAWCFFELSSQGHSLPRRLLFLFGLHATHNLMVLLIALV
jgi:hypothetical protein